MMLKFHLDTAGIFFAALTVVMFALTLVYTASYMKAGKERNRFYTFLAVTMVALVGLCLAGNLITFYLFFELMSLVSFPLVLHTGTEAARKAAMKYLGFSVFGASMALAGMLMIGKDAALPFTAGGFVSGEGNSMLAAYLLMAVGFCCKAGLMPMSNWLPTAHPEAPAPASALLSGVITKAGMLGLIRVTFNVFGADGIRGSWAQETIQILALATILTGSMLAYKEKLLKKRLAFSSVSQLAYVILGVSALNTVGMEGALLQVLFHSSAKVGLFLCAGAVTHQTGLTRVDELEGLGKRMPVTFGCFAVFALSLVGIPPMGGFVAKWKLGLGALDAGEPMGTLAVIVLLVSALLTAGYLLPILRDAFFKSHPSQSSDLCEADLPMTVPLIVMSLIVLMGGALPGAFMQLFSSIGAHLMGGAL